MRAPEAAVRDDGELRLREGTAATSAGRKESRRRGSIGRWRWEQDKGSEEAERPKAAQGDALGRMGRERWRCPCGWVEGKVGAEPAAGERGSRSRRRKGGTRERRQAAFEQAPFQIVARFRSGSGDVRTRRAVRRDASGFILYSCDTLMTEDGNERTRGVRCEGECCGANRRSSQRCYRTASERAGQNRTKTRRERSQHRIPLQFEISLQSTGSLPERDSGFVVSSTPPDSRPALSWMTKVTCMILGEGNQFTLERVDERKCPGEWLS